MGFFLKYLFAKDRLLQIDFLSIFRLPAPGRRGYARHGAKGLRRFAVARGVPGVPGVPGVAACGSVLLRFCPAIGAFVCVRRPSVGVSSPLMPRLAWQGCANLRRCAAVALRGCFFLSRHARPPGSPSLSAAALPFRRRQCVRFLWLPGAGALGLPFPLRRPGGVPGVLRPSGGAAGLLGSAALSPRPCCGAAAPPLLPL